MTTAQVALPEKLIPLFIGPADVRGSHGGRGSAKTRSFAKMAAVWGYKFGMEGISGIILCARQFMNSLDDSSLEEVKRAIEEEPFLAAYYAVGEKFIRSKDGRINFAFAGLDKSIDSIKSKGRVLLCWVDEAEPVTKEAWSTLIPTLREEGTGWNAELWVTWNPKRKGAACEERFRFAKDALIRVVEMNWRDNPKFPEKLERERQRDMLNRPEQYEHIWEGAYATIMEGAYYAASILKARAEGRIGNLAPVPSLKHHLMIDIGGTGARADAFAIWDVQFPGREIRHLNYYEAVSQPIATHLNWMRSKGLEPANTQIWLPHDGESNDKVIDISYESAFKKAGYSVEVVPNQGKGAAKQRIEAAREHFPAMWFDETGCAGGLASLGWYHELKDDKRQIGLGPEHDWSSHGADAFGLGAIVAAQVWAASGSSQTVLNEFTRAFHGRR